MLFDLLPSQWQEAIPSSKYLLDKIDLKSPLFLLVLMIKA
jgi:hypothetical protein